MGCRSSESRLLDYVPKDSVAIIRVNWKTVRPDDNLKALFGTVDVEGQITRFGIESGSVSEILIFATGGSRGGLFFRGSFDRRKVTDHLNSDGWNETTDSGRKFYCKADDCASVPKDGVIIAGTRDGLVAALHAAENSREGIASVASFKKIRTAMPTDKSPIVGYLIAPDGTLEAADTALSLTAGAMSLFGLGEIGAILKKLNIAAGTGLTVDKGSTNDMYAVNFCVLMRDEQAAMVAAGALNAMKSLSSVVGTSNEKENLQSFNITRNEKVLSIKMEMPRAMLKPPH